MSAWDPRFWRDRSVFVTGATGLQGSWLTKALHDAQAEVVVLVRDWVPGSELSRSGVVEQLRVVRGELCDQALVDRILGEYEVDTVLHLGAQTIVPIANRHPLSTFDSNIRGTWTLLEACRRSPTVRQIVVASSDKAYGDSEQLPYREDAPLRGRHPYDVSKSCADLLAQAYAATYQLPVAISRCGNLYGGGDLNWNRVIPGTIRSILRGTPPVIRSDGSMVRDYFYVEDGVSAYLLLAEHLARDSSLAGDAFNFSNEHPISVLELVEQIRALMGAQELKPVVLNQAMHEVPRQYLDASKATARLGWQPRYDLAEGLQRTIAWYRAFFQEQPHGVEVSG